MYAKHLNTLTSLRFFAASMIVLLHMNGTFWKPVGIQGFATGVSFFFVLSGFILRLVYGELGTIDRVKRFYAARIARIWPTHLLSIVLLLAVTHDALPSWKVVIANVLLLQSWVPHLYWYFSLNGVAWSISTELFFYAIFPLLTWRLVRTWPIKVIATISGIAVCSLAYQILRPENSDEANLLLAGLLYINPLARVFEFLVGMLAATLYLKVAPDIKGSTAVWTGMEIGACALVGLCISCAWPVSQALMSIAPQAAEWALQSGSFWALALLIFIFAFGRGALSVLLGKRPFVFLGEISFAVYMLHQIILRGMEEHLHGFISAHSHAAATFFAIVTLAAAAATFQYFERPIRNAVMRRLRRSNGIATEAVQT